MKKASPWLIGIGLLLFVLGSSIPQFTDWYRSTLPDDIEISLLKDASEQVSLSITLLGWLNILLGILCIVSCETLERYTHPKTFLIAIRIAVFLALMIHSVRTILTSKDLETIHLIALILLFLVSLLSILLLIQQNIDQRSEMLFPPELLFEICISALYMIPIILLLVSADSYIKAILAI